MLLKSQVFHMLPLDLCRLCSLTPGEDKLSFSVFWKVAPDLTLSEPRFTRSILHSCCQMSYEQAQVYTKETKTFMKLIQINVSGNH
jgi:exoribonuclease R